MSRGSGNSWVVVVAGSGGAVLVVVLDRFAGASVVVDLGVVEIVWVAFHSMVMESSLVVASVQTTFLFVCFVC